MERTLRKIFTVSVLLITCLIATHVEGAGNLFSGSLSTPILFDSSVYVGEPAPDYSNRVPVANPPGGLSATAAWSQYGMKLYWNVTDNGNGTYTYFYHFWPGWEPATNGPTGGGGGGTGNPYVTNKEVQGFDLQLGAIMAMADIVNPSWNVYQYNGGRIGSGTANSWINYNPDTGSIISQSSDYSPDNYPTYNYNVMKVANLKGKTGNATAGYLIQNLFSGLQWLMPKDPDTGSNIWKADINFDLTFTSTYAPGWGNFFTNSGQTGSNNNYTEVVAFDGTFDSTGKSIATWSNIVSTPGTPTDAPGTITISAPSSSITRNGPVSFTITYNSTDISQLTVTLSSSNISLTSTGSATGTIGAVSGTGNIRTVAINNIAGDGTLGISIAAGTASDGMVNAFPQTNSTVFIVDNTPPAVSATDPTTGAPRVIIAKQPAVTFSESLDLQTLNTSNFILKSSTGVVPGKVEYNETTHTATFAPDNPLSYNTRYTASVTTGIQDMAGNPIFAGYSWDFNTVPLYGDLTGTGGAMTLEDAVIELQIAAGLINPTEQQLANGDVGPLKDGKPFPDTKIDISDVVAILMKLVGLVNW